jgi:glycosyltransferase involved in cell wall biosynthesis
MDAADVVLHTSTVPEPFGRVVLEGLALGKTVVASQLGGPSEILGPGDGLLFDPASPETLAVILRDLAHDQAARIAFGRRAAIRAQAFDVQSNVDSVARLWSGLVNGRR